MTKTFRPWELKTRWLFPPSVLELVPASHLAHFVRDLVREELDLREISDTYREERGYPPYHPALMTALLLYGYTQGIYASRRLEKACLERVDFMAVTAMSKPDHSTIAEFRRRHQSALASLFVQVLQLCSAAGLVKLGHVALDGTKVKANASKHRAMSYGRMKEAEPRLEAEVKEWLRKAEEADVEEDDRHGRGRRGDELPAWVANRQRRLEKIREAKARLEAAAEEKAKRIEEEREVRAIELGELRSSSTPPQLLAGVPDERAQTNFTDPESRIMKTSEGFEQAYNCQLAVDAESQVIVAHSVSAQQNDVNELLPLVEQIEANTGEPPKEISADAGYCSEANCAGLEQRNVRAYLATGRQGHGQATATATRRQRLPRTACMASRLRRGGFRSRYRLRKQTVEPVIGQIKEARGFRRFLLRGLLAVTHEWSLVTTAHNLLKLAKVRLAQGAAPAPALACS